VPSEEERPKKLLRGSASIWEVKLVKDREVALQGIETMTRMLGTKHLVDDFR
jgi:hypothetical protein